jgi:hypothetical protein
MNHLLKNAFKCVEMENVLLWNVMMEIILMEMVVQKIAVFKVDIHAQVVLLIIEIIVILSDQIVLKFNYVP